MFIRDEYKRLLSLFSKIFVWCLIFLVLYILRSFSLLIFLTYIFSYIQASAIKRLESRIKLRKLRVVLVSGCFLTFFIIIGSFVIPALYSEIKSVINNFPDYLQTIDKHIVSASKNSEIFKAFVDEKVLELDKENSFDTVKSPTLVLLQSLFNFEDVSTENLKKITSMLTAYGKILLGMISTFLLSLLFSFLILLDLDKLRELVLNLKNTKLSFIYNEVSLSIYEFGLQLGRAFEAQTIVAFLNTILTGGGLLLLGIKANIVLLLVIVFFGSFVPIAGVFVSSVPICLIALQAGGFSLCLWSILLITLVHMFETYVFNPKIYGNHMHVNSVIVLVILTIAGTLFGVWGLLLGLPVCTYIFKYAIRR